MIRLNLCQRYKEAVRSSISLSAIPVNARASLKILYRTCNSIWRIAGDKSTDFSFYTRRISLATVYTSTLLFWLNDNSNNNFFDSVRSKYGKENNSYSIKVKPSDIEKKNKQVTKNKKSLISKK